jgi:hypothetical protein
MVKQSNGLFGLFAGVPLALGIVPASGLLFTNPVCPARPRAAAHEEVNMEKMRSSCFVYEFI